ncbi:MAG: hypothetical protein FWD13_08425 [Treponema sp.]|nr:hypothetical protein [Treponema sp.]
MSYSNTYRATVEYSGSVSYSYGPSQSGGSGTAYYSGSVPVDVTINVDTVPFDNSVGRFNTSIVALGGSVAAMQAAQCAAIRKTADEVSASLINGFFGTINTELSQQLQALDSAIKAGFGLIQDQGKAVGVKKDNMEVDYNRISSRYVKLFSDLDEECYRRIITLDRPSFNISQKVQKELINESSSDASAMNLLGIDETASSKMFVFVSSLNRKTLDILKTLNSYINQESDIKSLIDSFLFNEDIDERKPVCIPVIWSESDMLESQDVSRDCFIPNNIDQQGKQQITEKVNNVCSGGDQAKWKPAEQSERETLNREFNLLAETQFASSEDEAQQRVYKTMMSLWQNAKIFSMDRS